MMDKEKLKLIIRNLESLVDCLKSEVYSEEYLYKPQYEEIASYIQDYDEVFCDDEDDELLDLLKTNQKYKLINDDNGDGM